MTVPTTGWDETSPAGSQNLNLGDNRMREMKTQIREVVDIDHQFNSSGQDADNGKHKRCTFLEQLDLGTGATGECILGAQTVSGAPELVYTDEGDNDVQITSGGNIRAESISGVYPAANVAAIANIMNLVYPVGAVVTLGVSTNPGTLFGVGTWTAITGRVIVGLDSGNTAFDALNETGGQETIDLQHNHGGVTGGVTFGGATGSLTAGTLDTRHYHSISNDLSTTQDIMNPYIVKYVWERTA